jgi:hypothetical protein
MTVAYPEACSSASNSSAESSVQSVCAFPRDRSESGIHGKYHEVTSGRQHFGAVWVRAAGADIMRTPAERARLGPRLGYVFSSTVFAMKDQGDCGRIGSCLTGLTATT